MIIKLTRLEYYHSFRPPNRSPVLINTDAIESITERFDNHHTDSLLVMKTGDKIAVEESVNSIHDMLKNQKESV